MTDGGDSPGVPADDGPAPAWLTVEHDDQRREALPDLYTVSVVRTARTRFPRISGPPGAYTLERAVTPIVDARLEDRAAVAAMLRAAADELAPAPAAAVTWDAFERIRKEDFEHFHAAIRGRAVVPVTTGDEAAEFLNLTTASCRAQALRPECPGIPHVWATYPYPSHAGRIVVRYCPGDGDVPSARASVSEASDAAWNEAHPDPMFQRGPWPHTDGGATS